MRVSKVPKEFLRRVTLFSELDDRLLDRLAGIAREETFPRHHLVFREGDPVDAFYIVREGAVTVFRDGAGKPQQVLARLEEGEFFGEMGLLNDDTRRYASARTALPTTLLRIARPDLLVLCAASPVLEMKLRAEIVRRRGRNVSAILGVTSQKDVRIRVGSEVVMEGEDGARQGVVLENLSSGGLCLARVPPHWQAGSAVRFRLGLPDDPGILDVEGLVTWREGDTAGISFAPSVAGDDTRVQRALRRFLGNGQ
jgi:CRP-like cAMP-binding protein